MNNTARIVFMATLLAANGIAAAFLSKYIREGSVNWYWTYIISFISASIFAYQLKTKMLPFTMMSVFQSFFFHSAWYATAFFIAREEFQGHKIVGILFALAGLILISL
jgi:multidrug transporter EmrE-like cation transporter